MVRVIRHGERLMVVHPITRENIPMETIVFMEERDEEFGQFTVPNGLLPEFREHKIAVKTEVVDNFPIGSEHDLYINHEYYSTPQDMEQEGIAPRMIEGRPTYVLSKLSHARKANVDYRIDNDVLAQLRPEVFFGTRPGAYLGANVPVFTMIQVIEPDYAVALPRRDTSREDAGIPLNEELDNPQYGH